MLVRCLDRDPRMRLRDIGEARVEIDKTLAGVGDDAAAPQTTSAKPAVPRRRTVAIASAALLVGAAVAALSTWGLTRPPPVTLQPVRFVLTPTAAQTIAMQGNDRELVLSADGTHLVYVAGPDGQLMVRAIDALDAVPLGGITGARSPFLSPDGRWVGFFTRSDGELRKVSIAGGPPVTLCPIVDGPRGGSWGPDDTIIFADANANTGLLRVAAAGGAPTVLTTPDAARGEVNHLFPSILPNGRAVLFTVALSSGGIETAQVAVLDLTTGHTTTLIRGGSQAECHVAASPGSGQGYLVYAVAGALRAVRFDPVTLDVGSDPVPVVERVTTMATGAAAVQRLADGRARVCPRRGGGTHAVARVGHAGRPRGASGGRAAARLHHSAPLA